MRWLTDNWHQLLPTPWIDVALVLVAVLCGGIVGIERERGVRGRLRRSNRA